jgi:hypothetical protein
LTTSIRILAGWTTDLTTRIAAALVLLAPGGKLFFDEALVAMSLSKAAWPGERGWLVPDRRLRVTRDESGAIRFEQR